MKSVKEKSGAYKKWLETKLPTDRSEYKKKCAITKREVRKLNWESWDRCVCNIEYDVHGAQTMEYKIMSHLNKTENDTASINVIREETGLNYYKDLWTNPVEKYIKSYTGEVTTVDLITYDELEEILKSFKSDDMNVE